MQRILIIGSGGSGKSTLARRLGDVTGLPVVHLDSLYWRPGWVETAKDEWLAAVERVVAKDAWIIDGNYSGTLDMRLARCDTVIFLDMPRFNCLWRVIKRRLRQHGRSRPDMAAGCNEHLSWEFLRWIWTYPSQRRPEIVKRLAELRADQRGIVLGSPMDVEKFLDDLRLPRL